MAPTGTVLDHIHQFFYRDLNLCGCGTPEAGYELVRDVLVLAAGKQYEWTPLVRTLIGSPGAYHLVMSALDEAEVIGHGMSLDGAWLTDKGRWYASALGVIEDWDTVDDGSYPHDGEGCTDACWSAPIEG